jgi:hypothetical protein
MPLTRHKIFRHKIPPLIRSYCKVPPRFFSRKDVVGYKVATKYTRKFLGVLHVGGTTDYCLNLLGQNLGTKISSMHFQNGPKK